MRILTYKCYNKDQLVKSTTSWQEAKEWQAAAVENYYSTECTPENFIETEKEKVKRLATIAKRNERRIAHV